MDLLNGRFVLQLRNEMQLTCKNERNRKIFTSLGLWVYRQVYSLSAYDTIRLAVFYILKAGLSRRYAVSCMGIMWMVKFYDKLTRVEEEISQVTK